MAASNAAPGQGLSQKFLALAKQQKVNLDQFSLLVIDQKDKTPILSYLPDVRRNPASAVKILVSALALDQFGPAHRFETQAYLDQTNLCIKGGADPYLVYEELWQWINEISRRADAPLKQLVFDHSLLPPDDTYANAFSGDGHRAFTATLSALSLNFNAVAAHVYPGELGKNAKVFIEPDLGPALEVINQTKTLSKTGSYLRVYPEQKKDRLVLKVVGHIHRGDDKKVHYASVPSPRFLFEHTVKHYLRQKNLLSPQNETRWEACTSKGNPITHASRPLAEILRGMNKFSNNFIAEMLRFHLEQNQTEAWQKHIKNYFTQQLKLKDAKLPHIENASGLSRKNAMTVRDLVHVFAHAAHHPKWGSEFLGSMSIGQEDGTLRRRFKNLSDRGWSVRGKSGSLANTTAIVGNLTSPEGAQYVFAMINASPSQSGYQRRIFEEKVLALLVDSQP